MCIYPITSCIHSFTVTLLLTLGKDFLTLGLPSDSNVGKIILLKTVTKEQS